MPELNESLDQPHPSTIRLSDADENDEANLLNRLQNHKCSGHCMKPSTDKNNDKRECRSGAGHEKTKNECDTPGFELIDEPKIVIQRKCKKLVLERNHPRLNQSSIDLLKSWRGNCDIQFLIYDSPPGNPNIKEISRVTDYVVGYTCKGGNTLKEERETNKHLVMTMQETFGNVDDIKSVVKKIMNKTASRRLMSKQEASCLIASLPLTTASEMTDTITISRSVKIQVKGKSKSMNFLKRHQNRSISHHNMNMPQCHAHERKLKNLPIAIPHFVGMSGSPTFPVTENHAKQTLLVFKPWISHPTSDNWVGDFDKFINSKDCPKAARMSHDRVMQRHYNGTKYVDPVAAESMHDPDMTEEDEAAIYLSGMAGKKTSIDIDSHTLNNIHRGEDFEWDKLPKVRPIFKISVLFSVTKCLICFRRDKWRFDYQMPSIRYT